MCKTSVLILQFAVMLLTPLLIATISPACATKEVIEVEATRKVEIAIETEIAGEIKAEKLQEAPIEPTNEILQENMKEVETGEQQTDQETAPGDSELRNDHHDHNTGPQEDENEGVEQQKLIASRFTITSTLCSDDQGPDCTKLRLGDDYLTTSEPAREHLYSCTGPNPNAPGSIEAKITWINFVDQTWDFFQKLWLPEGTFSPTRGSYTETTSGTNRLISMNNLPVDGKIGDWPMTNYNALTEIDPNPGIPTAKSYSFSYPVTPLKTALSTCVSPGAIGVTKNGVLIFNASDGRGEDAVAREIVDEFGGHPAQDDYHYHFIPERLDNERLSDGHSGIVGYINDGFPIYGYRGEGGVEMSNEDLDICHGHSHGTLGYHYHATVEYPYTVGCYRGSPTSNQFNELGDVEDLPDRRDGERRPRNPRRSEAH